MCLYNLLLLSLLENDHNVSAVMHKSIVVPAPRDPGKVPGIVPGVYEDIVPCYPGKYPGHSGDVTYSCPAARVKYQKIPRPYPGCYLDITQLNRIEEMPRMQGRGLYQGRDSQLVPRYPGKYPGDY